MHPRAVLLAHHAMPLCPGHALAAHALHACGLAFNCWQHCLPSGRPASSDFGAPLCPHTANLSIFSGRVHACMRMGTLS